MRIDESAPLRVMPILQTEARGDSSLTVVAIEFYETGAILSFLIRGEAVGTLDGGTDIRGVVTDDAGKRYESVLVSLRESAYRARGELRVLPAIQSEQITVNVVASGGEAKRQHSSWSMHINVSERALSTD